jgi:hypothetical protein
LQKNLVIKKIAALTMLIVFAVSITPTIVFHNWFADHIDTVSKSTDTKGEQLGKLSFNCHCDHIVAESPFTEPATAAHSITEKIFSATDVERQDQFFSSAPVLYSLRGPPAVL